VSKAKTTPAPASPTPADHAPDSELANTGTDAADLVGLAGVLLLAGGAATVGGRHRRRRAH
jgi:LPXTG-motif cell wall-anchored protein